MSGKVHIRREVVKQKAFTLIELLVVIAIIGLLMTIFIPVARVSRQRGRISACANNLRQIGIALELYADDHNGYYPRDKTNTDNLRPLYPAYIDDIKTFMCPAVMVKIPRSQWVSKPEHLERARDDDRGSPKANIGMDYEYRGTQPEVAGGPPMRPSWKYSEMNPHTFVLVYDNDNRGESGQGQRIDPEDNHGMAGGNKYFADGSVRWYPADKWAFPLADGTDWRP